MARRRPARPSPEEVATRRRLRERPRDPREVIDRTLGPEWVAKRLLWLDPESQRMAVDRMFLALRVLDLEAEGDVEAVRERLREVRAQRLDELALSTPGRLLPPGGPDDGE